MTTCLTAPVACPTRAQRSANVAPRVTPFSGAPLVGSKRTSGFLGNAVVQNNGRKVQGHIRSTIVAPVRAQIQVEVEKPLGLQLGPSSAPGGGLVVKSAKGNAAKAGLKEGDTVIYTSSFFGDELWPSDDLQFTRSAIAAAPSPVVITYVKGENTSVNVKRLPKKPAPKRFGRKLSAAQQELATHICVDCGYIYCDPKPFAELSTTYRCPQCSAPKKRFATYDATAGKMKGGAPEQLATIATVVGGLVGVAILGYLGLTL